MNLGWNENSHQQINEHNLLSYMKEVEWWDATDAISNAKCSLEPQHWMIVDLAEHVNEKDFSASTIS